MENGKSSQKIAERALADLQEKSRQRALMAPGDSTFEVRALNNEVVKLMPVESRRKALPLRMASRNILPRPFFLPFP